MSSFSYLLLIIFTSFPLLSSFVTSSPLLLPHLLFYLSFSHSSFSLHFLSCLPIYFFLSFHLLFSFLLIISFLFLPPTLIHSSSSPFSFLLSSFLFPPFFISHFFPTFPLSFLFSPLPPSCYIVHIICKVL